MLQIMWKNYVIRVEMTDQIQIRSNFNQKTNNAEISVGLIQKVFQNKYMDLIYKTEQNRLTDQ